MSSPKAGRVRAHVKLIGLDRSRGYDQTTRNCTSTGSDGRLFAGTRPRRLTSRAHISRREARRLAHPACHARRGRDGRYMDRRVRTAARAPQRGPWLISAEAGVLPRSERDWWRKPPTIVGCGVAVLSVAAATIGTRWLGVQIAPTPLFFCAVMLSAWFGGVWPGLLATALSMLAVAYYFIPPINSFAIRVEYIPAFVLFSASALFVGWLSAKQRSAAQSLTLAHDERDAKVRELESSNDALQAEVARRETGPGAVTESEARLRALVGSIDEIVFEFDADGRYLNIWT